MAVFVAFRTSSNIHDSAPKGTTLCPPIPHLNSCACGRQEVTAEQTIGHLLQNLLAVTQTLAEVEKRLRQLEQQLAAKG
ncbi:MAG: hypothetical protein R3E79_27475 [Caldilineaceae bacterium]